MHCTVHACLCHLLAVKFAQVQKSDNSSSVLHLVDVQFWRSRRSLEGLSARSVLFGMFQSVIVFLYILDNDTNMVVIISVFISLLIDCWKITKVVVFTVRCNKSCSVIKVILTAG